MLILLVLNMMAQNPDKAGVTSMVFNATVNSTATEGGYIIQADVGEYQGKDSQACHPW
jgi:hypothetical protein